MTKIAIPLIITIVVLFALPAFDPDFGWFYRCGHSDCSVNTLSVILPNYQWTRPMAIYPKIIAFIFDHFSFNGLTVLNILIGLLSYFFFHKTLKTSALVSASAFIVSTILSFSTLSLGLRNQNLSLLYFLATIYLLTSKKIIFLPILFLIWANTHPSFPLGLIIIALYLITHPAGAAAGGIIAGLATLINPNGLSIYSDILSHFTTPMNTLIAEWVAPNSPHQLFIIFITIATVITFTIFRRFNLFFIYALIITAVLSLLARRNIPFYFYLLPIPWLYNLKFSHLNKYLIIPTVFIAIFTIYLILPNTIDINTNWASYCAKGITRFPCEAAEVLKKYPPGNIFHTYEWGGFLIWQLPQFKTFVDGRMPAWSNPSPYSIYLSTYQTQPGWLETLKKYNINYILISPGTFLDLELKTNKSPYKQIFQTETSVLYIAP